MPDPAPLAEVGTNHPLVVAVSACFGVAVTMAGAVAQALRFSGRIASAENAAKSAADGATAATAAAGKLADEARALRSDLEQLRRERPSQIVSEAEIQRRVDDAVEHAVERIEGEVRRLQAEAERLRVAAERGLENHHRVELAVTRLSVALERGR